MWIIRLTMLTTVLAFVSTVGLAIAFALAYKGIALRPFMMSYGGYFFPVPFVLTVITYLLRHSAGLMLLRRGKLKEALVYCQPRVDTTWTVGRNEAALNRYVCAEVHRLEDKPKEALALLEAKHTAPWRLDVKQLLYVARAQAFLALGRPTEAQAIAEVLSQQRPTSGSKEARAALTAALGQT